MEAFIKPSEILNQIDLRENMTAADFGCGSGGWAIPLAKKLSSGKVYAVDILEEPLSALEAKAKTENILNIQTIKGDAEEGIKEIKDNSCHLVLMTNLLFQCDEEKKVLEEGKRVLLPGGKILVVDWQENASIGPSEGKVSLENIKKMAEEVGLKEEKELDLGSYHYGLVLTTGD